MEHMQCELSNFQFLLVPRCGCCVFLLWRIFLILRCDFSFLPQQYSCFVYCHISVFVSTVSSMATRMLEQNLTDIAVHGSILPNKVFVGGLAEQVRQVENSIFLFICLFSQTETKDLRDMFSAYGPVQDVKIIVDRSVTSKSGDPRRYAFIAFDSVEDVKNVLAEVGFWLIRPKQHGFLASWGRWPLPCFHMISLLQLNEKSLDLHGRRLTVGQAYRKGPCTRLIAAGKSKLWNEVTLAGVALNGRHVVLGYPGADMNSAMFRAAFNNLAYQRAFQPVSTQVLQNEKPKNLGTWTRMYCFCINVCQKLTLQPVQGSHTV